MAEWIKESWEMENLGPPESSGGVCYTPGGGKTEGWDIGAAGGRGSGRHKEEPQG